MTVVLAALTEDGVVIASDSQISEGGWSKLNGYPDKIWTERELGYAFGSAGSIRVAQVVRFAGEWPKYREDEHDLPKFAVLEFVPVLKATLEQHGLLREKNGIHTMDAEFIVAWRDNFFAIGDDIS